eukprot:TRINITY_DN23724_c0_g1_i1.p1 TRINITY_DN23724_c0_g1~~TRINITY_DN23724_c0_g1_i1.p1  ORF type:complete len:263 (+),score=22.46 TRINITY_DN23724_c0_g1_i1:53-790(+)
MAIGWLQNSSRFMLILLQYIMISQHGCQSHCRFVSCFNRRTPAVVLCLIAGLIPAGLFDPNTLNEICRRPVGSIGRYALLGCLIWSALLLFVTVALAAIGIRLARAARQNAILVSGHLPARSSSKGNSGIVETRTTVWTVTRAMTILQALKFLTQVVNTKEVLFSQQVKGSFAEMLVMESFLEHGQLLCLLLILFFDTRFMNQIQVSSPAQQNLKQISSCGEISPILNRRVNSAAFDTEFELDAS